MRKVQFEAGKSQLIALFVSDDIGESVDPEAIYGAVAADAARAEPNGWRIVSMNSVSTRPAAPGGNILSVDTGDQFTIAVGIAVVYRRESAA
jgi:hypothetical protein